MMLSLAQRTALLEGTLVLDFIEIQLTQKKGEAPTIYVGPGSVEVDSEGQLLLKMFHKSKEDSLRDLEHIFANKTPPGQIIAEDYYYSLKATDFSGRVWTADSLLVGKSFANNSSGNIIRSNIRILKTENRHHGSETTLAAWIPGKYQIPTNEITKTSTGSSRNVFDVENELFLCRCIDKEKFLEISVQFLETQEILDPAEIFLEGLSLGLGKAVVPVCMIITKNRKSVISISSRPKTLGLRMGAPFRNELPNEVEELAKFLQTYLQKFSSAGNDFYGYWYRILSSTNDELENRALVLSVSIEGVVTRFFKQHGIPEKEVIEETDQALTVLKRLKKCDSLFKIREKVINCLAHAKKSTARGSLSKLANLGVLDLKMVQTWSIIRNKSAHAHQIDSGQSAIQEYVNQYHVCLGIFYRLLFQHIGYSGLHINYTKLDFPQEMFICKAPI